MFLMILKFQTKPLFKVSFIYITMQNKKLDFWIDPAFKSCMLIFSEHYF